MSCRLTTLFGALLLGGCAPAVVAPQPEKSLVMLLIGDFQTAADAETQLTDRRRALESLGDGDWLYLQLNSGADQKLYRQRVLQIARNAEGQVMQRTYALRSDADKRDLIADPARLSALAMEDLEPALAQGCEVVWRPAADDGPWSWVGEVDPELCIIYSERRQARIAIGAKTLLNESALWQSESGFDLQGNRLWGSAQDEYVQLQRQ
ncbi:MAG: chromophore lyase CpcT/CpeT [Pseudomonadota bacterium]